MQDRPTAEELLTTITDYLIGEVQPNVEGTLRYHTLDDANLCRMLERETRLYPVAAANERSACAAFSACRTIQKRRRNSASSPRSCQRSRSGHNRAC